MNDETFQGYPEPSSNTTYCPNQFFDVVLPHSSRGVVRLVGYMLRRVLGWSDAHGRPQEPTVAVSWNELERHAGIARGAIRQALDEAIAARFIRCLRPGRPHAPGQVAVPALYELCWDDRGEYITDPAAFRGFYAGNGNLTYIPNAFFDHTLRAEPLAVIRVVGAIIRNTIGWQTHYGFRRQQVEMSFTDLQRRTYLCRQALADALQQAITHNHLVRVEAGYFDREAGKTSKAATYGLKWQQHAQGMPQLPFSGGAGGLVAESAPAPNQPPDEPSVQKVDRGISSKSRPERFKKQTGEQFKKQTGLEITDSNNTPEKQQQQSEREPITPLAAAAGTGGDEGKTGEATLLLLAQGFDEETAVRLAASHPGERIRRQCEWVSRRTAQKNRLGLLRRAIEQDWPEPRPTPGEAHSSASSPTPALTPASVFAAYAYAGLAGNTGQPQAVPSAADVQASEPFVLQLLEECPDEKSVPTWGRQFGGYVKQTIDRTDRGVPPRSIALALRMYGDAFYLEFKRKQQSQRRQTQAQLRQAHQERFAEAYQSYLRERREELRLHHAPLWQSFLVEEEKQRSRIERMLSPTSPLRMKALETFDAGSEQLTRLLEFFKDDPRFPVLAFWAWDAQLNPERLVLQAA